MQYSCLGGRAERVDILKMQDKGVFCFHACQYWTINKELEKGTEQIFHPLEARGWTSEKPFEYPSLYNCN